MILIASVTTLSMYCCYSDLLMLSVCHHTEYYYAECPLCWESSVCLYAECHYAEYYYAKCRYAQCRLKKYIINRGSLSRMSPAKSHFLLLCQVSLYRMSLCRESWRQRLVSSLDFVAFQSKSKNKKLFLFIQKKVRLRLHERFHLDKQCDLKNKLAEASTK